MARIQCLERLDTLIWYHWKRTVILSTICSFDGEVSSHHRLVKYIKSHWDSWSKWLFCVSWRSRPRNPVIHSREGFLRQVFRVDLSNALQYHLTAFPLCTTVRTKCRVPDWPPNGGRWLGMFKTLVCAVLNGRLVAMHAIALVYSSNILLLWHMYTFMSSR